MRQFDGVIGSDGERGKGGRKMSIVDCGGIECLNRS
jgi:hypothetical protein